LRSLRSLVAAVSALGPGPPDLAHRKVSTASEANPTERGIIGVTTPSRA
jgi:hypothetical protein